ncbi:Aldehyde dehydrogenase family 2 member C4 [Hordeum vulgare]|nr:Aldehyde dehydrogenase family 2 member C4 [Hordeum vulgare]
MASERNGDGGKGRAAENGSGGGVCMEMPEIRYTKLFINGAFVDAVSARVQYLYGCTIGRAVRDGDGLAESAWYCCATRL